jgi:hypothetical protein
MATVTKLKAAVNNKNLPILGEDGNLYNYYVGRYTNKMSELGYTLTTGEKNALNAFVEAGISDGWIDKLVYMMPLIGFNTNPKTGIVPLVDAVADYEITDEEINGDEFVYDLSGKIKSLGGKGMTAYGAIPIPVNSGDFEVDNCWSLYFNTNLISEDITTENYGIINRLQSRTNQNTAIFMRKGGNSIMFERSMKIEGEEHSQAMGFLFEPSEENIPCQLGLFYSIYKSNGEKYYKGYSIRKGNNSPEGNRMNATNFSPDFPSDVMDYTISGASDYSRLRIPINIMAFFKPQQLTESDIYSFNQAVFSLTTALGR